MPRCHRGGRLHRRRPARPGRRQLVGTRYGEVSVLLGNGDGTFQPAGHLRGGVGSRCHRGGRLHRRRPARPGRRQLRTGLERQSRCCWATATAPSSPRSPTRWGTIQTRSWRVTSPVTASSTSPSPTAMRRRVSVLLGNGDGTFQPQVTYAVGIGPRRDRGGGLQRRRPARPGRRQRIATTCRCCWATATAPSSPRSLTRSGSTRIAIVAGDFNGDGRLDLAVSQRRRQHVSVLLGNGDGTFQTPVRSQNAVGSDPAAIVAGDFNGDGQLDLAVANDDSNDVSVLLGNGDGTFQPQVTYAVGSVPIAIVAGDFNGDGRLDLAVANVRRQRRLGPAGQRRRHLPAPGHVRGGVAPGRHRGGRLQRRRPARPGRRQSTRRRHRCSVLLGNGDGTFQPQVTYAVGIGPDRHRGG